MCCWIHPYVWHTTFICVTCLYSYVLQDSFICVKCYIRMCYRMHSYVWCIEFICVTEFILMYVTDRMYMCYTIHSYVWRIAFICVAGNHSYVWHIILICVTGFFHMCDGPYSYVFVKGFIHMCGMNASKQMNPSTVSPYSYVLDAFIPHIWMNPLTKMDPLTKMNPLTVSQDSFICVEWMRQNAHDVATMSSHVCHVFNFCLDLFRF